MIDPNRMDPKAEEWISRPSGFVEGVACDGGSPDGNPIVLDQWQKDFIDFMGVFGSWRKTRQGGFSFACASRGWSRCYLDKGGTYLCIFTSYNLEDAKEKIRYVDMLDRSLPEHERMPRKVDTKFEIEFSNSNRIVTMFMPRGKGSPGHVDVMLDELAHMQDARTIWQAGLPVISRGGSVLCGSSPLAASGMFHDVHTGAEGKFQRFKRFDVLWWCCTALCTDVGRAVAEAPGMPTHERVARFGTVILQDIFDGMFLEDFRTEYECEWSDETTAFFSWQLLELCSNRELFKVDTIDGLRQCHGDLFMGMDVGRRKDLTEFIVGEKMSDNRIEVRLNLPLYNRPFREQREAINKIMSLSNVRMGTIDRNGIGMQLAEEAKEKFGSRIIEKDLTMQSKAEMATYVRRVMELGQFAFYADREMRQQFHSIKKIISPAGNILYDTSRNEKHHADKFWAAALMLNGSTDYMRTSKPAISVIHGREDKEGIEVSKNGRKVSITMDPAQAVRSPKN